MCWEPLAAPTRCKAMRLHHRLPRWQPVGRAITVATATEQLATASGPRSQPSSSSKPRRRFTFAERCQQLSLFREQHGHTRVPLQEPTGLGAWAGANRHAWKSGQLTASQQQQLAALGFCVDAFEDAWAARFHQLAAFHSEHGHCNVPPPHKAAPAAKGASTRWLDGSSLTAHQEREQYPGLHTWLQQQRHRWRQGTLPDGRQRRLEGLGVLFHAPHELSWEQHYAELLAYREEHGHVNVPARWPPNPALAAWVEAQRRRWRGTQGARLTASQHSRLISCGFQFEPQQRGDEAWDSMHTQLLQLQQQRGGTLGGRPLPTAGGLRQWAAAQRQQWRQGVLPPKRASRLAALGLLRGARERWLDRLAELDVLVACLGLPAVHALLLLAPSPTAAAAMAEAAMQQGTGDGGREERQGSSSWHAPGSGHEADGASSLDAAPSGDGGPSAATLEGSVWPWLGPQEAAVAVRWWFRHLHAAAVPVRTVRALQARGLGCLLLLRIPSVHEPA